MIADVYKNSFKEVYYILQNTEEELLTKIPPKFINFLKENMNENYRINIQLDVDVDKQPLLKETEAILALIYRSFWATDNEKQEFSERDYKEFIENEKKKKTEFIGNDIYEIFESRKNINKITIDNNLSIIKKDNFLKRFFTKILNMFKNKKSIH